MTTPLKILFVWHHHQPYYKTDGTFLMPWVRMHGIKDYWDMVRILDDYPGIKQTFNFAPSLLEQIADYLSGSATDEAYLLSMKDPASFSEEEKVAALKTFFLANPERMIRRYPRYAELLSKRGPIRGDADLYSAKGRFNVQDFRDLQVWWNLVWVGEYSRYDKPFKFYLDKQSGFTEEEKRRLLTAHLDIMARIIPHHVKAIKRKQIEVSVSPFYHPILPLLCDTEIATAANPAAVLPSSRFKHPDDAESQIKSALDFGRKIFGHRPDGMWPSEGSVSDSALKLVARNGISWVATDEAILHKSLLSSGKQVSKDFLEKYFPYNYSGGTKPVKIFFRDHALSDKIGFVYSHWSPDDAAHDFVSSLLGIRDAILRSYGESGVTSAMVPVILDGENAWEFYQSDGKDFLRTLYYVLENEGRLKTVLPSEVNTKKEYSLRHVEPGSWINGNFNIWIGHEEDNRAWDLLNDARKAYHKHSGKSTAKARAVAFKEISICEGSDWCWWYGDEHKSAQATEFDVLFRHNLKKVYEAMGIEPPAVLEIPIKRRVEQLSYRQPLGITTPSMGRVTGTEEWKDAGYVEQEQQTGAMQQSGMQIKRLWFGNDESYIYLMIQTTRPLSSEKVIIEFFTPARLTLEIGSDLGIRMEGVKEEENVSVNYVRGEAIKVRLNIGEKKSVEATLAVSIFDRENHIDSLPRQGVAKFTLIQ